MATAQHDVLFVAYDRFQILDLTGPHEVFDGANAWLTSHRPSAPRYRLTVAAPTSTVRSESGLAIVAEASTSTTMASVDTVLVVGGNGVHAACDDADLVRYVANHATRASRFGSVCTGTFLLAEAGLVDGRAVATHWARAHRLRLAHPGLEVDDDALYVHDGPCWTSAGVTAGIDMALAMVEQDHGAECAQTCARWLVMFLHRPGGQSQFSTSLWTDATDHDGIRIAIDAMVSDPGGPHSVAGLAAIAAMSERHFTRVFTRETGVSPGRYLERVRTDAARHLLESTQLTTEVVADRCGFGTGETLRRSFLRTLGTTPSEYRRRFALSA